MLGYERNGLIFYAEEHLIKMHLFPYSCIQLLYAGEKSPHARV